MDFEKRAEVQREETAGALQTLLGYADKLAERDLKKNRERDVVSLNGNLLDTNFGVKYDNYSRYIIINNRMCEIELRIYKCRTGNTDWRNKSGK